MEQARDTGASATQLSSSHWDEKYEAGVKSAWTVNPMVAREVNRRMSGDPGLHWLNWFFERHLENRPERMLSIGCGDGAHELIVARNDYVGHVTGFDASPSGVARANAAATAEGLRATFEVRLFEDFASSAEEDAFDLVLFAGSLHHVRDIEPMLFAVQKTLRPGGLVLVNEYVGAAYQLYPKSQIDLINTVLRLSPPSMRLAPDVEVQLPTMRMIYDADPSEGVRAPLIRPLLPRFFRPVFERLAGGGLLHSLFDGLNATEVNKGSPESERFMRACIDLENMLTDAGMLQHDFLFACYENVK